MDVLKIIDKQLIHKALLIRRFEEKLLELFRNGELHGTIHTCIGQEMTGVALGALLKEGDRVFSNHRGHGHFLGWKNDLHGLLSEVMGKKSGICGGIGGSQHLCTKGFMSNGIQGGMMPISVGTALGIKLREESGITVVFIGDGTLGEGIVYESLNLISKWDIPILVIVENNGIAQTTRSTLTLAGTIENRAKAFSLAYTYGDTRELESFLSKIREAVNKVRKTRNPMIFEAKTYRLMAHSKGDDTRPESEIKKLWSKDPLTQMLESGELDDILDDINMQIEKAVEVARSEQAPSLEDAPSSIYYSLPDAIQWTPISLSKHTSERFAKLINSAFHKLMNEDKSIVMLGEDILSPYGGAFKITKGISKEYPERVFTTPISEAAIVGIGTGLALSGLKPVVEIMFGDFMSLTFDHFINHACKFHYMYNGQVEVPLVVRTPMGGYRGYGPTHSQSIEKHFLGIPSLTILALNTWVSPLLIYSRLFKVISHPALIIENKVDYTRFLSTKPPQGFEACISNELFPCLRISPKGLPPNLTVIGYGGTLRLLEEAVVTAFEEFELLCEIICPSMIHPLNIASIIESAKTTGRIITIEEGAKFAGLGSEIIAQLICHGVVLRKAAQIGNDSYVPTARELEEAVLPSVESIINVMREIVV